jgi:cellulose synthase operon protein YhjU
MTQFFTGYSLDIKWWNVYFVVKIYLFFSGIIDFDLMYNVGLFFFITLSFRIITNRFIRNILIGIIAVTLLYFDSYLPPFNSLLSQLNTILEFDNRYLIELVGRFIEINYLIAGLILCLLYSIARKYLRITVIVLLIIIYIALSQKTASLSQAIAPSDGLALSTQNIDQQLNTYKQDFFLNQSNKQTHLAAESKETVAFDMLFISICSLSRDDLTLANLDQHPIFQRFDITFTNYNSATSYSGPAVVRLLRAGCGQTSHADLFEPASNQACYLFENLQNLGFTTEIAMNHNGAFDNFSQLLRENGRVEHPIKHFNQLSPYQIAFDGSPIQRDYEVLQQLITDTSQTSAANHNVTLYNTISLHDGNRIINSDKTSSLPSYKKRLTNLLDDLDAIYQQIEDSGRNIVVVFIPEHGSGLRGDKIQISGIRDIPSPAIVNIPVGITLFGQHLTKDSQSLVIEQPSSHLALGQFIANLLDTNTFGRQEVNLELLTANLPLTPTVAENSGVMMITKDGNSYITLDEQTWNEYPNE